MQIRKPNLAVESLLSLGQEIRRHRFTEKQTHLAAEFQPGVSVGADLLWVCSLFTALPASWVLDVNSCSRVWGSNKSLARIDSGTVCGHGFLHEKKPHSGLASLGDEQLTVRRQKKLCQLICLKDEIIRCNPPASSSHSSSHLFTLLRNGSAQTLQAQMSWTGK